MEQDLRFDVALSYASQDEWLARDLHDLVTGYGFSVYCAARRPDLAHGFIHERLRQIYTQSDLNIVLWSGAYSEKPKASFVAFEHRSISVRHVGEGEADSLMIVRLDDTPLREDLQSVLYHNLATEGVVGLTNLIFERLKALRTQMTVEGDEVIHPPTTEAQRGTQKPCVFRISRHFKNDRLGRWERLADVLVDFVTPAKPLDTPFIYLIPSGLATPWLRHTEILKQHPEFLERKRRATLKFAERCGRRELNGSWFAMRKAERDIATAYCPAYDRWLNADFAGKKLPKGRD